VLAGAGGGGGGGAVEGGHASSSGWAWGPAPGGPTAYGGSPPASAVYATVPVVLAPGAGGGLGFGYVPAAPGGGGGTSGDAPYGSSSAPGSTLSSPASSTADTAALAAAVGGAALMPMAGPGEWVVVQPGLGPGNGGGW